MREELIQEYLAANRGSKRAWRGSWSSRSRQNESPLGRMYDAKMQDAFSQMTVEEQQEAEERADAEEEKR